MKNFAFFCCLICFFHASMKAQFGGSDNSQFGSLANSAQGFASGMSSKGQKLDSFAERVNLTDSIKISYQFLDFKTKYILDSAIGDINDRLYLPKHGVPISNDGSPVLYYLYQPNTNIGWNSGSNIFDSLMFTERNIKIYKSTFPYSTLGYVFGSNEMQGLNFLYTQNINSQFNFGGEFKSFSSPGFFKSQNTFNYRYYFYFQFESIKKTYQLTTAFIDNVSQASNHGGIIATELIRDNNISIFFDRANVPVNFNNSKNFTTNILNNQLDIGNQSKNRTLYVSQLLSFGESKKIKIINKKDTSTHYYKIPKFTIEYVFKSELLTNTFVHNTFANDSIYYLRTMPIFYNNIQKHKITNLILNEQWHNYHNRLAFTFFTKTGKQENYINTSINFIHNKKRQPNFWDTSLLQQEEYNLELKAKWINNFSSVVSSSVEANWYKFGVYKNAIDTSISNISLIGNVRFKYPTHILNVQVSYVKSNPIYFASPNSIYYLDTIRNLFVPEEKFIFSIDAFLFRTWRLQLQSTFIKNLLYYKTYESPSQENELINITQISLQKEFKIGKNWNWHMEYYYQPDYNFINGNNVSEYLPYPQFWTFQRFGYNKKINSTATLNVGLEAKYNSPYKAPNYSPVLAKFVVQPDSVVFNYPILNVFFTLKIRGFHLYWKIENINTITFKTNALNYTRNNFATPFYPTSELNYKVGVYWNLVN